MNTIEFYKKYTSIINDSKEIINKKKIEIIIENIETSDKITKLFYDYMGNNINVKL